MVMVPCADDPIIGFEREADARLFWEEMRERLREFSLTLHPEKTRLIEFGRHAAINRAKRGLGKPETFQFSRLHADLREIAPRQVPPQEENPARPQAREAAGNRRNAAAPETPTHPEAGRLVAPGRCRLFRVSCRSERMDRPSVRSAPRHRLLARGASAAQPERPRVVGAHEEARRRMAATAAHPSSVAKRTLRRQTPEVGAGCPNWARPVLCGGRSAMSVPTANATVFPPLGASGEILGVAHVLHPVGALAFKAFLNGDMRHRRGRGGAVPVFLARPDPDDVARADDLDRKARRAGPGRSRP